MQKQLNLKYGTQHFSVEMPAHAEIFDIRNPPLKITKKTFLLRLHRTLESLQPDFSRTAVVISDKTRLCDYPVFLPLLLQGLEKVGAASGCIRIYIAYGTHGVQTQQESLGAYGETYRRYAFIHHDFRDEKLFKELGRTSRGTPITLRKDLLKSTFVVTFGAISHHYFAGYGGGRKLIFPGLGLRKSIYLNHGLFLDKTNMKLVAECRPGLLPGNPVAEDLDEIEDRFSAHLALHGILDDKGRVSDIRVGRGRSHFLAACAEHGKNCEIGSDHTFDLVVASCGGHPKDINFIQAHKAIENAAKFARDGGTIVILARCPDGVGSKTFLPWFELGGFEGAFRRLADAYEGNGGTALSMMSKVDRVTICMVTDMDDSICRKIGIRKIRKGQAEELVKQLSGSMAVLPNAGLLVNVGPGIDYRPLLISHRAVDHTEKE
ncbi:MAG: lactate racemase domain-containing protein [Pseudomonadota bacterium]